MLFGYIWNCNREAEKTIRQRRIKSLLHRIFHGTSNRRIMNVHENEDIPGEEKYNPSSSSSPRFEFGKEEEDVLAHALDLGRMH